MNKKIKDLALEAGLYVDLNGEPWPRNMTGEDIEAFYEKFANLIVDECAKKVDKVRRQGGWYYGEIIRKEFGLYDKVWQAGTILLPVKSVGVMGDERTYEFTVALRAVTSVDGMTADWAHLPYEFLAHMSNSIINEVRGINRVVYDISSKPPATIEWE